MGDITPSPNVCYSISFYDSPTNQPSNPCECPRLFDLLLWDMDHSHRVWPPSVRKDRPPFDSELTHIHSWLDFLDDGTLQDLQSNAICSSPQHVIVENVRPASWPKQHATDSSSPAALRDSGRPSVTTLEYSISDPVILVLLINKWNLWVIMLKKYHGPGY